MSTEEKHTIKGWGHRLREENRSLKEKAARLKKEVRLLQKEVGNTWKLIEGIPGGIVLLQQQKIILANETACRELGYTREEMLTKKLPDIVHPDSAQIAGALQRRTAADQILPGQYEIYLTTKGGQTLCAEVRASKIWHHGRRALLLNMVIVDKRSAREKRLRQSVKREALVRMASGLNHELEESIALLGEQIRVFQAAEHMGGIPLQSLRRLEAVRENGTLLFQHLDCLTRTEYHPSELALLDLKKVLRQAVTISRPKLAAGPEFKADNFKFKTYLRALSPVYGSRRDLQDVFVNLILNATEALNDGGEVYLTTEEHSGAAHIYFQDTGAGISEEIIDRIFDPFFTTKDGTRRGLGLSLAHAIIARHGGEISVTSQEDQGSTFVVKLPLAQKASLLKGSAVKKGLKDARILIIGDEGVVTDILYKLMAGKGGRITITPWYDEGVKLLKDNEFDLVLVDLHAAETETVKNISQLRRVRPGVLITLIDAMGMTGSLDNFQKMGADLVVGRPLDMDRLLSRISSLLETGTSPE